jgi:hypothetical protein
MNDFSDEDPKLRNFLRQHRSIIPPVSPESEDRLMAEIDLLPIESNPKVSHRWWRYIGGGIGIILTGVVGATMHQLMNPPEPSLADLQQLNLYLEAHAHTSIESPEERLRQRPELNMEDRDNLLDLDPDLFSDNDSDES